MRTNIILPVFILLFSGLLPGQTTPPNQPLPLETGLSVYVPTWRYKMDVSMNYSQRIGPAAEFLSDAADALTEAYAAPLESASYFTNNRPGIDVTLSAEYTIHKKIRLGLGLGYHFRNFEEQWLNQYTQADTFVLEDAQIETQLHYLSPSAYISGNWKYFAVMGGFRANFLLGGETSVTNNLPSFLSQFNTNYGGPVSTENPADFSYNQDGQLVSSNPTFGGYYPFYVSPFIRVRIQPFGERYRPYVFFEYSPFSDPYRRNITAADYTRILLPAIQEDEIYRISRMSYFSFGIGIGAHK